jgi:hypothetical protein
MILRLSIPCWDRITRPQDVMSPLSKSLAISKAVYRALRRAARWNSAGVWPKA